MASRVTSPAWSWLLAGGLVRIMPLVNDLFSYLRPETHAIDSDNATVINYEAQHLITCGALCRVE